VINGTIIIDWADGKHKFNVAIFEQAFELEEKCSAGLLEIFERVSARKWRVTDLFETIRIGLIGGGATPAKALSLCRRYVEGRPWAESVPVAQAILVAALVGVPDDNNLGKQTADQTATEPDRPGMSDPQSTDMAQPLGSAHAT
jgi:hypothetical protein